MALYEVLEDGTIVPKAGKTVGNLDCVRTKVLWTNPNPTASFANTSIDLKENNCDFFEIRYRYNTTYDFTDSVTIPVIIGKRALLSMVNTPVMLFVRAMTVTSQTKLTFASSYYGNTAGESIDNSTIIPVEVIGITKQPAMIYTGKELFAGNGISVEDGVISAKIETIYDKHSNDSSINKGYTSGIQGNTWSAFKIDDKYTQLKVYAFLGNKITTFFVDLTLIKNGTLTEITSGGLVKNQHVSGNNMYIVNGVNVTINSDLSFTVRECFTFNISTDSYTQYQNNANYCVYKVEGVY